MTKVKVNVQLTIELDEPAAVWLRDLMRQPLYDDETPEERKNRRGILFALSHADDRPVKRSEFVNLEDDIPW